MKVRKAVWILFLGIPLLLAQNLCADEPKVTILVLSEEVKPGEEIVIELTISHNANTYLHHVEWVEITINDMDSTRWGYGRSELPPDPTFKKEFKYKVPDINRLRIEAEASCIRHGSSGKVILRVPVKR